MTPATGVRKATANPKRLDRLRKGMYISPREIQEDEVGNRSALAAVVVCAYSPGTRYLAGVLAIAVVGLAARIFTCGPRSRSPTTAKARQR